MGKLKPEMDGRRRDTHVTGWRRHRLYSYGVGRRDVTLVGFLVLCGMFLAFLSELKEIFVLFIWRKQELSGDMRILGTGEEMECTGGVGEGRPMPSKPGEIQVQLGRKGKRG